MQCSTTSRTTCRTRSYDEKINTEDDRTKDAHHNHPVQDQNHNNQAFYPIHIPPHKNHNHERKPEVRCERRSTNHNHHPRTQQQPQQPEARPQRGENRAKHPQPQAPPQVYGSPQDMTLTDLAELIRAQNDDTKKTMQQNQKHMMDIVNKLAHDQQHMAEEIHEVKEDVMKATATAKRAEVAAGRAHAGVADLE